LEHTATKKFFVLGPISFKATELMIPQKAARKGVNPLIRKQTMTMRGRNDLRNDLRIDRSCGIV